MGREADLNIEIGYARLSGVLRVTELNAMHWKMVGALASSVGGLSSAWSGSFTMAPIP